MKKRIIALGFFDGVHLGHRTLLDRTCALAAQRSAAACAVTFDRSPGKGGLLTTLPDRIRLLKTPGGMDEVLVLPFDAALMQTPWDVFAARLLSEFGAVGLVCGEDYRFGAGVAGTPALLGAFCEARGITLDVLPQLTLDGRVVSSSLLKSLVAAGEMAEAQRCYGHPHTLSGTVVPGQKLGHTLGFPTANLIPDPALLLPKNGVYAVRAAVDGAVYTGVCNVGTRPTVHGDSVTVETWLDGYDGDLYGKLLTLDFYDYLRPERKFESLDALKAEIFRNQAQARACLSAR